jgi:hypothetical protein
MKEGVERIKFDLPFAYTRALRMRAALDGNYPRDVLMKALDMYLEKELAEARKRIAEEPKTATEAVPGQKKRGRPTGI